MYHEFINLVVYMAFHSLPLMFLLLMLTLW